MRKTLIVAALAVWLAPAWALANNDGQAVQPAPRAVQRAAPRTTTRVPQTRTRYESGVMPAPGYYRSYVRGWHASYGNRPASSKVLGNY